MAAAEPIVASVHIEAEPAVVYDYFTQAEAMVLWMGDFAHLEAHPGGDFTVNVRGAPVRGRYLVLEPPHRLVFTWGYAGSEHLPPGGSTVEVRLTAVAGGTSVLLEHRGLPPEEVAGHDEGWPHYLERLSAAAVGRDPGPDHGHESRG